MKNVILIAVFCLPIAALAQIQKGKSVLSGSVNYTLSGNDSEVSAQSNKSYQFTASSSYGYLIGDRWAIGITPSFLKNRQLGYGADLHYRTVSIGPFVRRYFPVGEKFFIHVDGGMNAAFSGNWLVLNGEKSAVTKSTGLNFYVGLGASYFVSGRIALQASLGNISYSSSKTESDDNRPWNFGTNFGLSSLTLGAAWYF
jgi:hypothetical protein